MGGVASVVTASLTAIVVAVAAVAKEYFEERTYQEIEKKKRQEIDKMNRELLRKAEQEKAKSQREAAEIDRKTALARAEQTRAEQAKANAQRHKKEADRRTAVARSEQAKAEQALAKAQRNKEEADRKTVAARAEQAKAEQAKAKAQRNKQEADRKTAAAKKEAERLKEASCRAAKQKEDIEKARQAMTEKDWGPRPDYIKKTDYAVGFTGRTGVGKTSLWNAFVRNLFSIFLSASEQVIHRANVPFGKVGAVETTTKTLPYRFPGTSFIMSDIPGHSTFSFQTQNYVRDFSIGYYDVIFYTYSGRLMESDVGLLLNFIMYDINFRLLRQKFRQDLVGFAENEFREINQLTLFDDLDDNMAVYVQDRIKDVDFIRKVKGLLHEEVIKNWAKLLDGTGSSVVQSRRTEFVQKISDPTIFYCVDSKCPKLYDTGDVLHDIKAGMDARGSSGAS